MTDSAWSNLECTQRSTGDQSFRKHTIPGWNTQVKPFHGEARFWFSLWVSAGKPLHSSVPGQDHDLFKLMKLSRNNYHYAVRRAQKAVDYTQSAKLVSKIGSPDLFKEIEILCKDKRTDLTSVVDGVNGMQNISNHFKNIYENLYNEHGDIDQKVIDYVQEGVISDQDSALVTANLITSTLVKTAVRKLKADKSDVSGQFTSDCLKSAPDIFFTHLAALFRAFLIHGYICSDLIICDLCPIVKDSNGEISSSKNYRGIAISSLILKVFDNCILLLFGELLSNDALQFGFQKGCSTVQCTWAVQETISHYLRGGSEVFCCLLDFLKRLTKLISTNYFKSLLKEGSQLLF